MRIQHKLKVFYVRNSIVLFVKIDMQTVPSFKLKFSLGFITSCYVIFSLSMVQAMDIFMITYQDITKPRENCNLKLPNGYTVSFCRLQLKNCALVCLSNYLCNTQTWVFLGGGGTLQYKIDIYV